MGRLTFKNDNGTWGLKNYDIKKVPSELYGAICKLKDYEESGFSPKQLMDYEEAGFSLEQLEESKWIDIGYGIPNDDRYILVSFENYDLPAIGRYDDGAFYPEDNDKTFVSYGLFVNAWMELPKPYREDYAK